MFVVLEGLDRSGKTTTASRLCERLAPLVPTVQIRYPTRDSHVGSLIDRYLRKEISFTNESIHLLFCSDRYEHRLMVEEKRRTHVVLCDRYSMSGAVYSAAKGLDLDWCIMSDSLLPKPDLTVFIDTPMDELARRKGFGDEIHDDRDLQQKIHGMYMQLLQREQNVLVVDGCLSTDEIVEIVAARVLGGT